MITMTFLVRYVVLGLAILASAGGERSENQPAVLIRNASPSSTTSTFSNELTKSSSVGSSVTGVATCPSRTVNYITHTLAQQCLRTDWQRARSNLDTTTANSTSLQLSTQAPGATQTDKGDSTTASIASTESASSLDGLKITDGTTEQESALDNANFLSFEEWKKQNLARAGQSSEGLGARQHMERKPPNVNALESLGEESEIEIDFAGFGAAMKPSSDSRYSSTTTHSTEAEQTSPASQALRPRDAGKTCKERTNYASFDCAATILKSNKECKSASSVLMENKDSYMLNKCSASDKYFIVELCNDILVDTVVLANYEFFSSIFRTFRVSVSDRYPAKADKWRDLGTFEARNTRDVQAFLIVNPLIWARYIRIEFLTHYGSEYYCPVSLLRVHGTTMMEEFRNQEELARGESQEDDAVISGLPGQGEHESIAVSTTPAELSKSVAATVILEESSSKTISSFGTEESFPSTSAANVLLAAHQTTCPGKIPLTSLLTSSNSTKIITTTSIGTSSITNTGSSATSTHNMTTTMTERSKESLSSSHTLSSITPASTTTASGSSTTTNTTKVEDKQQEGSSVHHNKEDLSKSINSTKSSNSTRSASATTQQPQPSTQESFFKSISKRLQQLESNSTLSLQYIEEQSRILRDAFSKVEKRQLATTTTFLSNLNNTVMAELKGFRQAYDQLWQSTVIELEGQREQHQLEMTALGTRLTLVVDELVWQKRMGIVQSTLLLLCLGLVLFARPKNGTFEASIMQQVMARSQAAFRSGPGSDQYSPAQRRSPVSLLRRKLWQSKASKHGDSPSPSSPEDMHSTIDSDEDKIDGHVDIDDVPHEVLNDAPGDIHDHNNDEHKLLDENNE